MTSNFDDHFFFQEVLEFFGMRRTDFERGNKFQGVETPSQVRTFILILSRKIKVSHVQFKEILEKTRGIPVDCITKTFLVINTKYG